MATILESLQFLSSHETQYFSLNSQSLHRLNIFQSWLEIAQKKSYDLESKIVGKETLDIGCGQGDMIELFAATLKTQGNKESRVTGVDPASLDYGESKSSVSSMLEKHSIKSKVPLGPLVKPTLEF
jgi:2-polyprenyl-3-methyl-5-hydroxy-6-metoxy-1,4-benzoquinol methylase